MTRLDSIESAELFLDSADPTESYPSHARITKFPPQLTARVLFSYRWWSFESSPTRTKLWTLVGPHIWD